MLHAHVTRKAKLGGYAAVALISTIALVLTVLAGPAGSSGRTHLVRALVSHSVNSASSYQILPRQKPLRLPRIKASIRLSGRIINDQNVGLVNAIVELNGTTAVTKAGGTFRLAVPLGSRLSGVAWAPGYQEDSFTMTIRASGSSGGSFSLAPFKLDSALANRSDGAVLRGLTVVTSTTVRKSVIRGSSRLPAGRQIYVTQPDGLVTSYPLKGSGRSFRGTIRYAAKGIYTVEIPAADGLPIFNLPVFHGVAPSLPVGLSVPADPKGASRTALATFALGLINSERKRFHLSSLAMRTALRRVSQAHDNEMIRDGYFTAHPHVGANGSTPGSRVKAAHIRYSAVGECVGEGPTVGSVIAGLFGSPSHRQILLDRSFHVAGIGLDKARNGLWALVVDLIDP